ncbi:hypothetical protein FJ366_03615 [Candidatus Dependentiae bacterium]|nr:hypothetical protein [Candidatus Dependentiae bacterium]
MRKVQYFLISTCLLFLGVFLLLLIKKADIKPFLPVFFDKSKEHRIVVFVHGTFGVIAGLASAPSLWRDKLEGSIYRRIVSLMRRKNFFYSSQPLLGLGLIGFESSSKSSGFLDKFAIKPIAYCYEECAKLAQNDSEIRHYYGFGWSGLLSQKSRRRASVRLLNQLHQEILKFRRNGIEPKITLLCHSHGGNVALNMGIIAYLLKKESNELFDCVKVSDAIQKNEDLLASLSPELPLKKEDLKWMYRPAVPDWNVEELVLLATPLQEETDTGIMTSFFKQIDSFYSFADHIQTRDIVSTKNSLSNHRFTEIEEILEKKEIDMPCKVRQIRLMYGRAFSPDGERIVLRSGFLSDPGHKDFWHLIYPLNFRRSLLRPVPLVALYPVFKKILNTLKSEHDVDLNISSANDVICFSLQRHDELEVIARDVHDRHFFKELRRMLYGWRQKGLMYQIMGALYLL